MATVKILKQQFTNDKGELIDYERLAIIGYVSGELHTLELKLSSSELMLAKMLLSSNEEKPSTQTRHASEDEKKAFDANTKRAEEIEEPSEDWLDDALGEKKKK